SLLYDRLTFVGVTAMVFVWILLAFVVSSIFKGVNSVPHGVEYTVQRFVRYTHTLSPGLGFIVPWVDAIRHRMNMMEQVLDVPSQDVITRYNAVAKVAGVVFFTAMDATKATYEVAGLGNAVLYLVMTIIR